MKVMKVSEAVFTNNFYIDLTKDKKLSILINLLAIVSIPFFYLLFFYVEKIFSLNSSEEILFYWNSFIKTDKTWLIVIILVLFTAHELIHALFFYLFTKERPVIGFKVVYGYAGAPDWYIEKKFFYIISLSPFVLITASGFGSLIFLPENLHTIIFIALASHAAGCIGDIWISLLLFNKPKGTYVNDSGISAVISY